jgi:ABC-type bacteriocin/lantibiotic exporter with double-glycine peptidase domain
MVSNSGTQVQQNSHMETLTEPTFTVGTLVAFQIFAGKLSQPVMRIVGLWTRFQQAKLMLGTRVRHETP